ncbi:MAG: dTMP kinase [Dehalococcoidales bacterium]|nr:dTMP kinase [Dehalococcoidales bacterium]
MALFITFEGGEGCGKSVQSRRLCRRLTKEGIPVLLTHEPGITDLGKRITRLLKWSKDVNISPTAELLLFNTSRAQLVEEVIRPNLNMGVNVICDRYADSTTAYQGYGRRLDMATVAAANRDGTLGLVPDLTILLDMPVEEGLARKGDKTRDRFEKESVAFHQRVRKGYLKMAEAEPGRWLVVDAALSKDKTAGIIWGRVSKLIQT